jgi:hypothetical protein
MPDDDNLIASSLVLLVSRLIGSNEPTDSESGAKYLTNEQTQALATEGISLLASLLPDEANRRITSVLERLPRAAHGTREEMLMNAGSIGARLVKGVGVPGDPFVPVCMLRPGGGWICFN